MKFISLTAPIGILFVTVALAGEMGVGNIAEEPFSLLLGATATVDGQSNKVFSDPLHPKDILLFPSCWIIRLDEREVVQTNRAFILEGEKLRLEKGIRARGERLAGVPWNDAKQEISIFSTLFRKPRFTASGVKFWTGKTWAEVRGLKED